MMVSDSGKLHKLFHEGRCIRKEFIACKVERDGLASGFAVVIQARRRRTRCLSIKILFPGRQGTNLSKGIGQPYSVNSVSLPHIE